MFVQMLVLYVYMFLCIILLYPATYKNWQCQTCKWTSQSCLLIYSRCLLDTHHTFSEIKISNILTNLLFVYCNMGHLWQTWLAKQWRCVIIPRLPRGRGLRTHHNTFPNLWPQFHFIDCRKSFVWIASKHHRLPCWTVCTNRWHHCSQCVANTKFVVMTTHGWPHRGRNGCGHAG